MHFQTGQCSPPILTRKPNLTALWNAKRKTRDSKTNTNLKLFQIFLWCFFLILTILQNTVYIHCIFISLWEKKKIPLVRKICLNVFSARKRNNRNLGGEKVFSFFPPTQEKVFFFVFFQAFKIMMMMMTTLCYLFVQVCELDNRHSADI